jgi:adenylate cyclase
VVNRLERVDNNEAVSVPVSPSPSTGFGALEYSLADVRSLLARGEYLAAFEATSSVSTEPGTATEIERRYLRAFSLARSGATEHAKRAVGEALQMKGATALDSRLDEDIAALAARIAKDEAAQVGDPEQFAAAARAYEEISDRLGRPYACINAATLWMLAGRLDHARVLARRSIDLVHARADENHPVDEYWDLVTEAEASIVLGDLPHAEELLQCADLSGTGDLGARASTRRQLNLIASELDTDLSGLVDALRQPEVVHYTGHMTRQGSDRSRLPVEHLDRVAREVEQIITTSRAGFFFGGLACGADIIIAEQALACGAELHVVLPFETAEYVDISVRPGGDGWETRFRRCLDAATTVTQASDSAYLGDDVLFEYASRLAMGAALNRARQLESNAWQLAVWDQIDDPGGVGTSGDVRAWREAGGDTRIVTVPSSGPTAAAAPAAASRRAVRSILFGDFSGFSRLRDQHVAAFVDSVMGPLARALEPFEDSIVVRNTWGDGLFLVLDGLVVGAQCALAIQEALGEIDLVAAGLPGDMSLRLAGHVAPVLDVYDPLLKGPTVMGRELTRAARVEPRTPTGQVYVTSAFAGLMALTPGCGVTAEYVGVMTTAKDFESAPVYRLRRSFTANAGPR